jgi:RNA polymerase sigma-70 factor (ECF subfamily)
LQAIDEETRLMRLVGQGDAAAYRTLADRHLRSIVSYAYRLLADRNEAEDIAQETFLRLWTGAGKWKPEARLTTWLHRVAHNLCIDHLRRRRERGSQPAESYPTDDRPSGLVERRRIARTVEEAVGELPERQRAAIMLVHYQGLTNLEAAEVLQVGVEALESLLARARGTLRERLAGLRDQVNEEAYEG